MPENLQNVPAMFDETIHPTDTERMYLVATTTISFLPAEEGVILYVTGLTPATLAVVRVCHEQGRSLTCYHFDRDSGDYYPQKVL